MWAILRRDRHDEALQRPADHPAAGELLRELTIDPTRDYQPSGKTRYPHRKTNDPEPP
jgi:hypothetical protein